MSADPIPEVAWFAALCDDDYEYLGVPDMRLRSSWEHCGRIVRTAEAQGFDSVLLPSGYTLGIDSVAFGAGIAVETDRIRLLLAVRMGEMVLPQLARQVATIDQMAGGRLLLNIISSDVPGETLPSEARYRRTIEHMAVLRQLLNGDRVEFNGDFVNLQIDPPRARPVSASCPPFYFGGLSEPAKDCAAAAADVYLMWPDTPQEVRLVVDDMRSRASKVGRNLRFGWRSHVIVGETEDAARAEARRLVSRLDTDTGAKIRTHSLDVASAGVSRQNALREDADDEGYVSRHLWTGIGRARSGAGAAIVGDPDQVADTIRQLQTAGVESFIFSGYPHLESCETFGRLVLAEMAHGPLAAQPSPRPKPASP